MTKDWLVRDREAGNVISEHSTMELAYSALKEYADEDIANGYETDEEKARSFYEVVKKGE